MQPDNILVAFLRPCSVMSYVTQYVDNKDYSVSIIRHVLISDELHVYYRYYCIILTTFSAH